MYSIIETFRLSLLGRGTVRWDYALGGVALTLALLASGMLVFNRTERTFIDTV
jgi:lipopolysaccharide transport system permease protein